MTAVDPFSLVGETLEGRYRIDSVVGEGGFGVVYKAFHLGFRAPIAIKVLKVPPGLGADDRARLLETFDAEGNLLFGLSKRHPAFVQVTEKGLLQAGEGGLTPYLILEWLDGRSLEDDLEERRGGRGRSLEEVIETLAPVAEALAIAHAERIAHRDVKPGNIFLMKTERGFTAKLLDFGIAKVMSGDLSAGVNDVTQGGVSGFTMQYGAPEQWRRTYGHTGPWTDVYAFALLCVEMLTDAPVLDGDEPGQLMGATLDKERPTPRGRGAPVSDEIEEVFRAALTLRAEERTADLGSFWAAFVEAAAKGSPAAQDLALAEPTSKRASEREPRSSSHRLDFTQLAPIAIAEDTSPAKTAAPPISVASVSSTRRPLVIRPAEGGGRGGRWAALAVLLGLSAGGLFFFRDRIAETDLPLLGRAGALGPSPKRAAPRDAIGKMIAIAGGTFQMGSDDRGADERPVHAVTVKPFYIDATEVTISAYLACKGCKPLTAGMYCNTGAEEKGEDKAYHPVNCVDWSAAEAYCKEQGKRLPTEEEWEYVARGGAEQREYPWGAEPPSARVCWDGPGSLLGKGKRYGTCEVGAHPTGDARDGVHDLAGNVWEWTSSVYCETYDTRKCSAEKRVVRGGSWSDSTAVSMRASNRFSSPAEASSGFIGFRCAQTEAPPPGALAGAVDAGASEAGR